MLQHLGRQILELHGGISLRSTVEHAARIGALLSEAKGLLPHGEFLPWVRRLRISVRTAQVYMQANAYLEKAQHAAPVSIREFQRILWQSRRLDVRGGSGASGVPDENCRVVHADCRGFDFPDADLIVVDPPWTDLDAYRWSADLAVRKLKDGGVCLVQCGQAHLPVVLPLFSGLTYRWTLAFSYRMSAGRTYCHTFQSNWRPVLMFSKADWKGKNKVTSDTFLLRTPEKEHHQWQQPLKPWLRWLEALSAVGDVILDPFAGTGTIGVAVKTLGGRTYVGTEIEGATAKVAQERVSRQDCV